MTPVLGLDGGGTGCRAALADGSGRILGRGTAGPCNILSDREGALASIHDCTAQALAGVDPARTVAVLGVAGANFAEALEWLLPRLPFRRVRVVQDSVTSTRGALGRADGIVAAIGTGSVFVRQIDGHHAGIGGWGPILGDEGSGNWLGRRWLSLVLRAEDGLEPRTEATRTTLARWGGPQRVVRFAQTATAAAFAAEARQLVDLRGDAAVESLLGEGATLVAQSIDRLQDSRGLPVCFTGGLGPIYAELLQGRWPQRVPEGTALDGALAMARDLAAAS